MTGACSVKIGNSLMHESLFSEMPEACGRQSSFYPVSCACCNATVGRMIQKSQVPSLEDVRGLITLNTAALCSHMLGSYDLSVTHASGNGGASDGLLSRMQAEENAARRDASTPTASGSALAASMDGRAGVPGVDAAPGPDPSGGPRGLGRLFGGGASTAELEDKVQQLDLQMVEVQNLLLLFNERIAKLEGGAG
eukprot:jgi/Mesvir1/12586/Mv10334-RA.1